MEEVNFKDSTKWCHLWAAKQTSGSLEVTQNFYVLDAELLCIPQLPWAARGGGSLLSLLGTATRTRGLESSSTPHVDLLGLSCELFVIGEDSWNLAEGEASTEDAASSGWDAAIPPGGRLGSTFLWSAFMQSPGAPLASIAKTPGWGDKTKGHKRKEAM